MKKTAYARPGTAVVVTGAAGGIGSATARRLAHDGFVVICVDRDDTGIKTLVDSIGAAGGQAHPVIGDVSQETTAQAIAAVAQSLDVPLTGIVNNAGMGVFGARIDDLSLDEWNRVIGVNLTSVFLIVKHALPLLRETGGAVVNVASIHAYATSTGVTPYTASKTGVLGLTRAMALDLADDAIRVVGIAPGAIDTPLLQSHAEREGTTVAGLGFPAGDVAIGRVGSPDEAANTIRYLLSDQATLLVGTTLHMEAGKLSAF